MGASRYMATSDYRDEQTDRTFKAGEFVTGTEFQRLGEPAEFAGADYPEDVQRLRDEYGITDDAEQAEEQVLADQPTVDDATQDDDLDGKTVEELRELAVERNIEGRSNMNKSQLVQALRNG